MNASAAHLAHWADIEPLLDQALALPATEREGFLDTLPAAQQRWRGVLAELLRHEAQAARAGFLSLAASLPEFAASAAEGATPSAARLRPGQVIGPWLLLEELGRGGMASVWLARRQAGDFQREVALKLPLSPAPSWADRFRRERDILARLSHPGIARLLDAGVSQEGLPWLAMERVQGVDILAWCDQQAADVDHRVALLLQIADALQYAHSQLVVHRDIKPANVLVQADGQVRLLDFGIARLLAADGDADPRLTQLGQRPMTPEYASPEQVRGEEPGVASDVYALGVLAYRLLSGASPYAAVAPTSRHALERAVVETVPPAPSAAADAATVRKALRGDLDAIVLKALAKESGQRYATVDAMAADLRRHRAGEPVLARPPSWRYRSGRFVARHRWAVGVSAVAVSALLGTTGWALASSYQARSEARRAEAMYGFVLGLFNPDKDTAASVKQPDMPLKVVIERGARRALTELKDQPEARSKLLHDLAPMVDQLGLIDLAATLAQTRVDEALRDHGNGSLEYADAMNGQLGIRESTGQFKEGYDEAKQVLAIYDAHHIGDPYRMAPLYAKLGGFGFRIHAPNPDDAAYLEQALALSAPLKDVNTSSFSLPLGLMRLYLGDIPKAVVAIEKGTADNRRDFGPESWQTATLEGFLGSLADHGQHPAQAQALLRHAMTATGKELGADNNGVARNEIGLAGVLFAGRERDEATRLRDDALRIVHLPANAGYSGVRDQVQILALGLSWRAGEVAAVKASCQGYENQAFKATTPYYTSQLAQVCAGEALHEGDFARAARWLDSTADVYRYFASSPTWTLALDMRKGELAQARGAGDEALRLWRRSLAVNTTTQLPARTRIWWLIAHHTRMDAAELQRMKAFRATLEAAGGEHYYAEYLTQLREAEQAQANPRGLPVNG